MGTKIIKAVRHIKKVGHGTVLLRSIRAVATECHRANGIEVANFPEGALKIHRAVFER